MKTLPKLGLLGLLGGGLMGCGDVGYQPANEPLERDTSQDTVPFFNQFGVLYPVESTFGIDYPVNSLATGDFDGDGDLDLAVGSEDAIIIYENKIPQKK
ncbi:MAG: hypothetical protein AABX86_00270 [Nanoarchaeota archaeon]